MELKVSTIMSDRLIFFQIGAAAVLCNMFHMFNETRNGIRWILFCLDLKGGVFQARTWTSEV